MKKLLVIALFVATAMSCKKIIIIDNSSQGVSTVVFKKDTAYPDKSIQVPQINKLLFTGILDVGNADGFVMTGIKFSITGYGDASSVPTEYTNNFYCTVEDGTSEIYVSEKKLLIVSGENSFKEMALNLIKGRVYRIKCYGDILSNATNNIGAVDGSVVSVEIIYSEKRAADNHTGFKSGQRITFETGASPNPIGIVVSNLETSTPKSKIILESGEDTALVYGLTSTLAASTVLEQTFKVQGLAAGAIATVKLYDGTNLVGQAPVVSSVATVIANASIAKDVKKVFVAKVVVGGVTSDVSNRGFNVTLDKFKYLSGTESKSDETDRSGYEVTVFKAIPKVANISIPLILANGVVELCKWSITAVGGDIAYKQYAYEITLNDQGFNDTLFIKNFQIIDNNGVDVTASYRITDVNGVVDTLFSESDTKLYVTRIPGLGESVIPFGTTETISFRALVGGFKHPNDGDGLAIRVIGDVSSSAGLKYLNTGGISGNAKLYSSPAASSSAQNFNFICSDKSSLSHSGQLGLSSDDWFAGEKIFASLPWNVFHQ